MWEVIRDIVVRKKETLKNIIVVILVVWAFYSLYTDFYERGSAALTADAQVNKLSICKGVDAETNRPIPMDVIKSGDTNPLYLCGYLKHSERILVNVYLKWQGDNHSFYRESEFLPPGYFVSKLDINRTLAPGKYQVGVELPRMSAKYLEFEVVR